VCERRTCIRNGEAQAVNESAGDLSDALASYVETFGPQIQECTGNISEMVIRFDQRGVVDDIVPWPEQTPEARSCVAHLLVDSHLDGGPGRSVELRIDLSTTPPRIATDDSSGANASVSGASQETDQQETEGQPIDDGAVRAALDEHAADILDCAGLDRVIVKVIWDDSHDPVVTFQGELAASPNERCMSAAISPALPQLQAPSGEVIHLVSRQ
jgi:hypothetical protein